VVNVSRFTYWIDLDKFKPISQTVAKKKLNWNSKFSVLFVGRLVKEKGILVLDEAALELKKSDISVYVAGNGPEFENIKNCILLGPVSQDKLPTYYNAADLLIVPSIHEEGFGRVILESLACGTPVIGSNRGAIPEAMDESVGELIKISTKNIVKSVLGLRNNKSVYNKIQSNTREFTLNRYGVGNLSFIASFYNDRIISHEAQ
jgi:glycosyltransferase involved in cell wall biosynthesis